jgi:16S rRNA (uracil1498-N3)-methyltransferase
MQRYFVSPQQMTDSTVMIKGDDVNHIVKVMRSKPGDEIICCSGEGRDVKAVLENLGPHEVTARIIEEKLPTREMPVYVTIAQGLPKGDKMELVIQKGTELGAFSFLPFTSQRTIVKLDDKKEKKRLERWQKIAKEAAEQSHRSRIPAIENVHNWEQLLALAPTFDYALFAYEKEEGSLAAALQTVPEDSRILLVIGPEGGFEEKEAVQAEESGMKRVSLGRRILRTETAPLYGLSCISYQFER